jgi:hypothetical protein
MFQHLGLWGFAEIEFVVVGCSSTQISYLNETRYIIHHRVALPPYHELKTNHNFDGW